MTDTVEKNRGHLLLLLVSCMLLISFTYELDHKGDDGRYGTESATPPPSVARATRSPGPDLTLDPPLIIIGESRNITFSIEEPNEGETVQINSTVTNNGDEGANATVVFYDGHPDQNDIIGSETVFVEPGLSLPVSARWNTSGEDENHVIFAVVDPDDVVNETDESNNIVQRDIVVNQVPVADAGDSTVAFVDIPFFLDGGSSLDSPSDMAVLNYTWDLGDGTTVYGEIVEHTYAEAGIYTVELAVRDDGLAVGIDFIEIRVVHLPIEITVALNLDPSSCSPGQEVEVSGAIGFEFTPAIQDVEIPLLHITIEIPETGDNWSTASDINGDYTVHITAPNRTGTFTVEASISYGPLSRSTSSVLMVSEGEGDTFFVTGSVFVVIALAVVCGLGAIYGGSELGRYRILLLVFVPLYTRIKKDKVLDHFHRGRLYNYIEIHPGITFTELKRKFAFNNGNLVYHLNFLEKTEFIRSSKDGRHRRFYIKGDFSSSEDFSVYVNDIQKRIISVIGQNPGITQSKIASILGTSRQKISYNINALDYAGLIRSVREGSRNIRYYPVEVEG